MNHLKKKPPKSKKDISEPKDFVHVEHVGLKDLKQKASYTEQEPFVGEASSEHGKGFSEVTFGEHTEYIKIQFPNFSLSCLFK